MQSKIAVLVDAALYNEIVLRSRTTADVSHMYDTVMREYLQRTVGDGAIWSSEHAKEWEAISSNDSRIRFGSPIKGYLWDTLFLPNGSEIRMRYKRSYAYAEIAHERFVHEGRKSSPSQFASKVANYTTRNAWRDLEIRLPGSDRWIFANLLRAQLN